METLDLVQGTPEWHAARLSRFTASEAPAMMGAGYTSRDDLLKLKKTGISPEITPHLQSLFDKGHAAEALARPIAEKAMDEEFYPVTGVSDCGKYLASFDGLTMDEMLCFEHKLLNEKLVAQIAAEELEPKYYWQLEHQMMVSGAEAVLFVCSDGTEENYHSLIYTAVDGRREQLIAGWELFEQDLAEYVLAEVVVPVEGEFIPALPGIDVQITAEVKSSNFPVYRNRVLSLIESVSTELSNDQDFANAEKQIKFLKEAKTKLTATKAAFLAQTGSLDDLMRDIDDVNSAIDSKRLQLEKLVKAEKEAKKRKIVTDAQARLDVHIQELQKPLGSIRLPSITADFAGAMKGKKLITAMETAVSTELVRAKLEIAAHANSISQNLELYADKAEGHESLFPDLNQLVLKAPDDLVATIKARIGDHLAAEQAKAKAKRDAEEAEAARQREAQEAEAPQQPAEATPVADEVPETVPNQVLESEEPSQLIWLAKTNQHSIYADGANIWVEAHDAEGGVGMSITAEEWTGLSALIDTAFGSKI